MKGRRRTEEEANVEQCRTVQCGEKGKVRGERVMN